MLGELVDVATVHYWRRAGDCKTYYSLARCPEFIAIKLHKYFKQQKWIKNILLYLTSQLARETK